MHLLKSGFHATGLETKENDTIFYWALAFNLKWLCVIDTNKKLSSDFEIKQPWATYDENQTKDRENRESLKFPSDKNGASYRTPLKSSLVSAVTTTTICLSRREKNNSETNYFQKALGRRVTQNLSSYKRTYSKNSANRSASKLSNSSKDEARAFLTRTPTVSR